MAEMTESARLVETAECLYTRAGLASRLGKTPPTIGRWRKKPDLELDPALKALLKDLIKGTGESSPDDDFTFIDLFAGIGGIRKGFESQGGRCVFTSEWDRFAQQTYATNFRNDEHPIWGDITKLTDANQIPNHNALLAGFPCQPFSLAGVSKKKSLGRETGFLDKTQGTLFFDVARIINDKQPEAFMLENVKNLLSHDKKQTIKTILEVLRNDLGYYVPEPKVIDARHFLPQHRERVFIVGFREYVPFTWDALNLPSIESAPTLASILHNKSEKPDNRFVMEDGEVNSKYILSQKLWRYLVEYRKKHEKKGNGFGFTKVTEADIARTLSARYHKDGSEILVDRGPRKNPRRLTPRECSRLMGFDRNGFEMEIPVSDTQAYRQFGNSVAVPVVEEVARIMKPFILRIAQESEGQTIPLAL